MEHTSQRSGSQESGSQSSENLDSLYLKQMNPLEIHALDIAKRQLKTSFDLEKSIGFLKYKTKLLA